MELTSLVFKTHIALNNAGDFVELREFSIVELKQLQDIAKTHKGKGDDEKTQDAVFAFLDKAFADCVVDHSLTHEGKKVSNAEAAEAIKQSGSVYTDVLTEWVNSVPFFQKQSKKKSGA